MDENELPEANGVSSVQWLVRMCPLSCYSAIYIANIDSNVSHHRTSNMKLYAMLENRLLTLCPDATARSSPWAWNAIDAMGRSTGRNNQIY